MNKNWKSQSQKYIHTHHIIIHACCALKVHTIIRLIITGICTLPVTVSTGDSAHCYLYEKQWNLELFILSLCFTHHIRCWKNFTCSAVLIPLSHTIFFTLHCDEFSRRPIHFKFIPSPEVLIPKYLPEENLNMTLYRYCNTEFNNKFTSSLMHGNAHYV